MNSSPLAFSLELTITDYTHVLRWNIIGRRLRSRIVFTTTLLVGIVSLTLAWFLSRRGIDDLTGMYVSGAICLAWPLYCSLLCPYLAARSIVRSRNSTKFNYSIDESELTVKECIPAATLVGPT